ncbi:MAG: transglycosylase SLT domain-containing protein, partial [Clostridia bacterium]
MIYYGDSGHVGIYVGNGMQVDQGGGGGINSESNPNWKGPVHRKVSNDYTAYIRYKNTAQSGKTGKISLKAGRSASSLPNSIRGFHNNLMTYSGYIEKYSKQHNIDTAWIMAIIATESGFNPNAMTKNPDGGVGLMQLEWQYYKKIYSSKSEILKPEVNISLGVAHFAGSYKAA